MKNTFENSFIIHSRDYTETSIIFEVLTENRGLITLLGKGIKKKKDFSTLQPFKELKLTFSKKSNFPILAKYEISQDFKIPKSNYLLFGIYINELIHKFVPQYEPCQTIYNLYKKQFLNTLANTENINITILNFEILFLKEIGYEISIADSHIENIENNLNYYYDYEIGFKEVKNKLDLSGSINGKNLKFLMENNLESLTDISKARLIIKNIFQRLLGEKKIKSYELFD